MGLPERPEGGFGSQGHDSDSVSVVWRIIPLNANTWLALPLQLLQAMQKL